MKQSELDYKHETGLAASRVERVFDERGNWNYETVPYDEYIEWLEERYDEYLKCKQSLLEASEISKQDWEHAVNEIGQLQQQIEDMEDEIKYRR
jgi:chromosome segregation ATPase